MAEKTTIPGLRVTAKVAGFRRAGRAWPAEPTDVPAADFTKEQVAALKDDPGLVVIDIEIEGTPAVEGDAAATKPAATTKKK